MTVSRIPLAGVIGAPIAHSLSPLLHGYWLRRHGLPGHYVPLHIEGDDLAQCLRALPAMGFVGVNVTIPHKEAVLRLADTVSDLATQIGAANTLSFDTDGRIHADNTDAFGFMENLRQGAPNWRADSGPATVLGAGGAARAVLASLLKAGVPEIRLTNRTRARAEGLAQEFGDRITVVDWDKVGQAIEDASLLINTTSLGMVGHPPLEVPLEALAATTTVSDIVYTPLETALLAGARAKGCATVDGLGMLLNQGVPGFERWFGQRPVVDAELRAAVLG